LYVKGRQRERGEIFFSNIKESVQIDKRCEWHSKVVSLFLSLSSLSFHLILPLSLPKSLFLRPCLECGWGRDGSLVEGAANLVPLSNQHLSSSPRSDPHLKVKKASETKLKHLKMSVFYLNYNKSLITYCTVNTLWLLSLLVPFYVWIFLGIHNYTIITITFLLGPSKCIRIEHISSNIYISSFVAFQSILLVISSSSYIHMADGKFWQEIGLL